MKTSLVNANTNNESVYKGFQQNIFSAESVLHPTLSEARESEHFVQFYEADDFLLNSLCEFTAAGLCTDEAVIVVATKEHREKLDELLENSGVDVAPVRAAGQYVSLDAAETLSKFMVGETPDINLFNKIIGNIVRLLAHRKDKSRRSGKRQTDSGCRLNCVCPRSRPDTGIVGRFQYVRPETR